MIPNHMHFFWHGGPMSWLRFLTLSSFRRLNPAWQITLHLPVVPCKGRGFTDDRAYQGEDYLPRVNGLRIKTQRWSPPMKGLAPAHACDLFEWQLLAGQGGWYADMDILFVRPMPEMTSNADSVWCLEGDEMAVGLFGSGGDNPVFREIYRQAKSHVRPEAYQCAGVEAVYRVAGLWSMTSPNTSGRDSLRSIRRQFPKENIVVLPTDFLYMHCWRQARQLYKTDAPVPETAVGVHWYGGLKESHVASLSWTPRWHGPSHCTMATLARAESIYPLPPSRVVASLPAIAGRGEGF
jgi:hypothetical protein